MRMYRPGSHTDHLLYRRGQGHCCMGSHLDIHQLKWSSKLFKNLPWTFIYDLTELIVVTVSNVTSGIKCLVGSAMKNYVLLLRSFIC